VPETTSVRPAPPVALPGRTLVSDGVVAAVASIAAREVPGVHDLHRGTARAVQVDVAEHEVAVEVSIVVEHPAPVQEVADQVRAHVAHAITRLTGTTAVEVDVVVADLHVADLHVAPGDASGPATAAVSPVDPA